MDRIYRVSEAAMNQFLDDYDMGSGLGFDVEQRLQWAEERTLKNNPSPEQNEVSGGGWGKLAKISDNPDKWLEMYSDYSEMLIQESVKGFWQEQFQMMSKQFAEVQAELAALQASPKEGIN
jgi:hypothetical protein